MLRNILQPVLVLEQKIYSINISRLHFTEQKREKQNTLGLEDAIAVGVKEIGIVGGFCVRPRRA